MLNNHINRFLGVLCYPFVSLDLLHHDLLEEYMANDTHTVKDKQKIRNGLIHHMRQFYTIYSYDEMYLYLDKWYLYPQYETKPKECCTRTSFDSIFEHLQCLSKSFISQRDGQIVYKYWENEDDSSVLSGFAGAHKVYLFHSLNRLIPLDILSIIYMVKNNKDKYELNGFYGNIQVSDALLDQVLERGVAENHLHSGVSASFLTNWDDWMKPLTTKRAKKLKKFSLQNMEGLDGTQLKFYLWLAALLRCSILIAIKQVNDIDNTDARNQLILELAIQCKAKNGIKRLYAACTNVEGAAISIEKYFIDQWEVLIGQTNGDGFVRLVTDVEEKVHTSDENLFLFEVIKFLLSKDTVANQKVLMIKTLFLSYLRIKNYFYGLNIQQKTIHGLDYFQLQYYDNNSATSKAARAITGYEKWERVIREQLQNTHLQKLELRTSISNNESDFKRDVYSFLKAYRDILKTSYCRCIQEEGEEKVEIVRPFPRIGLVFHLLKREQDYLPEKCVEIGKEDRNYLQFGGLYEEYKQQVENLKKLRAEVNHKEHTLTRLLDKYLVGLDVASLENTVPTWVFVPIYEKTRDSQVESLRYKTNPKAMFQSLGFTFHVGEDFRHLLSGLRRVDEVVRYLKFHAGDRIGHGIALGINPDEWYRLNATVIMPRIEALENYLWAYHTLSQNYSEQVLVNMAYLEKCIYELAQEIYGQTKGLTTHVLIEGYLALFKSNHFEKSKQLNCGTCEQGIVYNLEQLCEAESQGKIDSFVWDAKALVIARHCKKFVFKMNQPIHFKVTKQEIEVARQMQILMKQYISQQGIVVEVNPSSNIAIGDMDTLGQHQIYNINEVQYDLNNIMACINSDDPSVFNTNVSNELAYIYWAMLEKGVGREVTLQWIDKLRQNGMNASFIRRKETDKQILRELDQLIDNL